MVKNLSRLLAGIAVLLAFGVVVPDEASGQERGRRRPARNAATIVKPKPPPKPMLAVVGLGEQRIVVYDSTGAQMLDSPVSSGTTGYETPPGIFSVVQKEIEHASNLYDDASMPFMQRITWTGIALHAGALPGYPASHGCVRLPHNFAERLYDLTHVGLRVVVAREGIAPVAIAAPALFQRSVAVARGEGAGSGGFAGAASAAPSAGGGDDLGAMTTDQLAARHESLSLAAEDAARAARQSRVVATRARMAAQPAERALQRAEAALAKAEADLKSAEKLIEGGGPKRKIEEAEKTKAAAPARIEAARAGLEKVRNDVRAKLDAVRLAEEKSNAAASAHTEAIDAAERAKQDMSPVSVLVSRKTQRIYVRKGFHPLWEAPITIRDAEKPIGTFVYTANEPAEGSRELRWSALSLYKNPTAIEPRTTRAKPKGGKRDAPVELPVTDVSAAQEALERLSATPDMVERVSGVVLPGSSLIITDEPPSVETGKDTDFVVVMSGEPKGGLAIREQSRSSRSNDDVDDRRSSRPVRRSGGGFGFWFD